MIQLVCSTSSSNTDYDGDCTYAVVTLDAERLKTILAWMNRFNTLTKTKDDGDLDWMVYRCYWATYYSQIPDEWQEKVDGHWYRVVESLAPVVLAEAERTEIDRIWIDNATVFWQCRPKHGDMQIETQSLSRKEIEALLRKGRLDD